VVLLKGLADQSPRAVERVAVIETHVDHRRSEVMTRDFRPGHEQGYLVLPLPAERARSLTTGDEVVVVAGQGLLAWWRDEVRAAD
jgi:hypothetical protein